MFPKTKAERDAKYLAWVRTQPSVVSGQFGCVAHHVVGHGRCGTVKTSDYLAIPLTDLEHKALHQYGWRTWESRHGCQMDHAKNTHARAVAQGFFEGRKVA